MGHFEVNISNGSGMSRMAAAKAKVDRINIPCSTRTLFPFKLYDYVYFIV